MAIISIRNVKENTKILIREDKLFTIFLILAGVFSIGNYGKIIGGISVLDLLLGSLFLYSTLKSYKAKLSLLFWGAFVLYGFAIFAYFKLTGGGPGYDYVITESRYFLYFIVIAQVVFFQTIDIKIIEKLLPFLIFGYIVIYFSLMEGSFIYSFFNDATEDSEKFDFMGRINGPQTVFLSSLIFLVKGVHGKISRKILLSYLVLVVLVYVRTGSRTQLVVNLLPVVWILVIEGRILLLSFFAGVGIIIMPLFLNAIQTDRFLNILTPTGDSAFMFRMFNIGIMLDRLWSDGYALIFGYGLGSNYDAFIVVDWFESYFLDNTFVTMIYKIGLPLTIIFWIGIIRLSKGMFFSARFFYLIYIALPALISYHFISNPVYFLAYAIGVKVLIDNTNKMLEYD